MTPNPENPDPGPNAPRILVVDDDPVTLEVVRNILGFEGMVVTVAAGGHEALTRIDAGEVFDLVLLDVMVPGMAGFEFCREIRRRHNHDELPVLMLADKKRHTDLTKGLNSGANDCLGKPFAREELLARVHAQLKVRAAHEMALENNRLRCELELRVQTELALRLGRQRLDRMLHALPVPMVTINESREIAFCTRAFAERFGYRAHHRDQGNGRYDDQFDRQRERVRFHKDFNDNEYGQAVADEDSEYSRCFLWIVELKWIS